MTTIKVAFVSGNYSYSEAIGNTLTSVLPSTLQQNFQIIYIDPRAPINDLIDSYIDRSNKSYAIHARTIEDMIQEMDPKYEVRKLKASILKTILGGEDNKNCQNTLFCVVNTRTEESIKLLLSYGFHVYYVNTSPELRLANFKKSDHNEHQIDNDVIESEKLISDNPIIPIDAKVIDITSYEGGLALTKIVLKVITEII